VALLCGGSLHGHLAATAGANQWYVTQWRIQHLAPRTALKICAKPSLSDLLLPLRLGQRHPQHIVGRPHTPLLVSARDAPGLGSSLGKPWEGMGVGKS